MSSLFGLRQLSPKQFSELQEEQRKTPMHSVRSASVKASPSSNLVSFSSGSASKLSYEEGRQNFRQPLQSLSSNASATKSPRLSLKDRIAMFNKGAGTAAAVSTRVVSASSSLIAPLSKRPKSFMPISTHPICLEENNKLPSSKASASVSASQHQNNAPSITEQTQSLSYRKKETLINATSNSPTTTTSVVVAPPSTQSSLEEQVVQLQNELNAMTLITNVRGSPEDKTPLWRTRLRSLQQGIRRLEEDRLQLSRTTKQQSSHQQLRQTEVLDLLERREQEVALLSKRCAQQSEKLQAVHRLQASHSALQARIEAVQAQEMAMEKLQDQITSLQDEKETLQQQLNREVQESRRLEEALRASSQQVDKLVNEKQLWETRERADLKKSLQSSQQQYKQSLQHVNELQTECRTLGTQIEEKNQEVQKLLEQVQTLETVQRDLKKEMHQMTILHQKELEHCKMDHVAAIQYWESELDAAKGRSTADFKEQSVELEVLRADCQKWQEKCIKLETELFKERNELQNKKSNEYRSNERGIDNTVMIAELEEQYEDKFQKLEASLAEKDALIVRLQTEISAARHQKSAHSSDTTAVGDPKLLVELTNQVHAVDFLKEEQTKQFDDLNRRHQQALHALQQESRSATNLQARVYELEVKVDILEQSKRTLQRSIADYETKVSGLDANAKDLTQRIDEKTSMIAKLESELERTMENLMLVSSELAAGRGNAELVASLTLDLEALQVELATSNEALSQKTVEVAELEADILRLGMEMEMAPQQSTIDDLEMALVESNTQCRQLSDALSAKEVEHAATLAKEHTLQIQLKQELSEIQGQLALQSRNGQVCFNLIEGHAVGRGQRQNRGRGGAKNQDIFRRMTSSQSFPSVASAPAMTSHLPDVSLIDYDESDQED